MTSNPPMTHLERARAFAEEWQVNGLTRNKNNGQMSALEYELAALLAQVTNEAYERADARLKRDADAFAKLGQNEFAHAILHASALVRSLKVSP